eukprot:SAG31_NODE_2332_length_5931_cov_3.826989_2_plen_1362_part_00
MESEQEREQEQEQQKEVRHFFKWLCNLPVGVLKWLRLLRYVQVKARRDQQVEVEKFVDREYSRNQEAPSPWPLFALLKPPPLTGGDDDDEDESLDAKDSPFYQLRRFKLRHQESLKMPSQLLCSRNYFNPAWAGLRRIKNVIMVLEWAPETLNINTTAVDNPQETTDTGLRLFTAEENAAAAPALTPARVDALKKSFMLLSGGKQNGMGEADLANAIQAIADVLPTSEQIAAAMAAAAASGESTSAAAALDLSSVSFSGFTELLKTRHLLPSHQGRYYVAISLAEAETIRRVLHIRGRLSLVSGGAYSAEVALRYSPLASPGAESLLGDGGVAFDTSAGWRRGRGGNIIDHRRDLVDDTGATTAEAAVAHSVFRYFDGDMHYSEPQMNVLIRSLQASSTLERERFFASTVGVRRRMDRKWQETPLAKAFTMADEFATLKQRAQAVYVREALVRKSLKKWEAFMAFDSDDNGLLGPSEIYGALRWLGMPGLTADDVVDFLEAGDVNRDGLLDYKEYCDLLGAQDDDEDEDDNHVKNGDGELSDSSETEGKLASKAIAKVEAYGADEIREILVSRRRKAQEQLRAEKIRRETRQAALEHAIFEEELAASAARVGGANPKRLRPALGATSDRTAWDTRLELIGRMQKVGILDQAELEAAKLALRSQDATLSETEPEPEPGKLKTLKTKLMEDFERIIKTDPQRHDSLRCHIIVYGLPSVPAEKVEKLKKHLTAHPSLNWGSIPKAVEMPVGEDGKGQGYALLEFDTAELAVRAQKNGNNFRLDRSNTLKTELMERKQGDGASDREPSMYAVEFGFVANKSPLRTVITGREAEFKVVMSDMLRREVLRKRITCPGCNEVLRHKRTPEFYEKCKSCKRSGHAIGGCEYRCRNSWSYGPCYRYFLCKGCHNGMRSESLQECADTTKHETYLHCPAGTDLSLLLPSGAVLSRDQICRSLHDAAKRLSAEQFGSKELFDRDVDSETTIERLLGDLLRSLELDDPASGRVPTVSTAPEIAPVDSFVQFDAAAYHAKVRLLIDSDTCLTAAINTVLEKVSKAQVESTEQKASQTKKQDGDPQLVRYVRNKLSATHNEQVASMLASTRNDISFAVALEFRLPALPVKGQRAALIRLAPVPTHLGRHAKRQEASIYVDENGRLLLSNAISQQASNQLQGKKAEDEGVASVESKQATIRGSLARGRWHVVVASVMRRRFQDIGNDDSPSDVCTHRDLHLYIDGKKIGCWAIDNSDENTDNLEGNDGDGGGGLGLGNRIVLFGGGKQSEARGGDVRKVRVVDGFVSDAEAELIALSMLRENPLLAWAAVKIQANVRQRIARTQLAKQQKCEVKDLPGAKLLQSKRMHYDVESDDY